MVSCQKGPTRHAYAWQIGPFWQDTLELLCPQWIPNHVDFTINRGSYIYTFMPRSHGLIMYYMYETLFLFLVMITNWLLAKVLECPGPCYANMKFSGCGWIYAFIRSHWCIKMFITWVCILVVSNFSMRVWTHWGLKKTDNILQMTF